MLAVSVSLLRSRLAVVDSETEGMFLKALALDSNNGAHFTSVFTNR